MTNKRTQFLSRLLRISELTDELMEISDKSSKQPAYAKKIKLVQMNPCSVNLPQSRNPNCNPERGYGKVMAINKPGHNYNLISSYRSQTILIDQQLQKSSISPAKMHEHPPKCLFDRKRTSTNVQAKNNEDEIHISNSVTCEGRYPMNRAQQIYRRKLNYKDNSLSKRNYYDRRGEESNRIIQQISAFNAETSYLPVKSIDNYEAKKEPLSIQVRVDKEPKCFKSLNHISYYSNQKQIEEEKKAKLSLMKEINKNYAKPFIPPPKITAKSYIICQTKENEETLKVVVSYNSKNSQEVASLTKIMTCILVIQFCQSNSFQLNEEDVKIGKYESNINGTSADLQQGQVYTVMQLLYGLMLPSGNDASLALAVWCGKQYILLDRAASQRQSSKGQLSTANSSRSAQRMVKSDCYSRFISEMNLKAQALKMNKTHYSNSHGLINVNNRSTAYDIAVLSAYAMKNTVFREIVSCKVYNCTIKTYNSSPKLEELKEESQISNTQPDENQLDEEQVKRKERDLQYCSLKPEKTSRPATAKVQSRPTSPLKYSKSKDCFKAASPIEVNVQWQNTHKLLHSKPKQYLGIKTGITTNAGPCLSSYVMIEGRKFLIVVLNCARINLRFKETQILKRWLYKHEGIAKTVKKATNMKLTKSIKSMNNECEDSEGDGDLMQEEEIGKD